MTFDPVKPTSVETSIAPWLSVQNSAQAVEFYKAAFGATDGYRLEVSGGVVARLSVNGAEFWLSEESAQQNPLRGGSIRMILTVADPDAVFARALNAGATEIK